MRNLKRALSLVLAAAMLVGMMVVSASAVKATELTDVADVNYQEAVVLLTDLGIINGIKQADGTYKYDGEGNVDRASMAKLITTLIFGKEIDQTSFKGTTTDLTDVDGTWAEGYIKYCYAQGIISGRGDGKFDPTANVTAQEAAKMLLVALGYNSEISGYVKDAAWSINVARDAAAAGLYEGMNVSADKVLTRAESAQMIKNTLFAPQVAWNKLLERYELVGGNAATSSKAYISYNELNRVVTPVTASGANTPDTGLTATYDMVGANVVHYEKGTTVISSMPIVDTKVKTVEITTLTGATQAKKADDLIAQLAAAGLSFKAATAVATFANYGGYDAAGIPADTNGYPNDSVAGTANDIAHAAVGDSSMMTGAGVTKTIFTDANGDGYVDSLNIVSETVDYVSAISADGKTVTFQSIGAVTLTNLSGDTLAKGDVVLVTALGGGKYAAVKAKTETGVVTAKNTTAAGTTYTVNGTAYSESDLHTTNTGIASNGVSGLDSALSSGATITLFLDNAGKVIGTNNVTSSSNVYDLAYVAKFGMSSVAGNYGSNANTYYAYVLFADGTMASYEIASMNGKSIAINADTASSSAADDVGFLTAGNTSGLTNLNTSGGFAAGFFNVTLKDGKAALRTIADYNNDYASAAQLTAGQAVNNVVKGSASLNTSLYATSGTVYFVMSGTDPEATGFTFKTVTGYANMETVTGGTMSAVKYAKDGTDYASVVLLTGTSATVAAPTDVYFYNGEKTVSVTATGTDITYTLYANGESSQYTVSTTKQSDGTTVTPVACTTAGYYTKAAVTAGNTDGLTEASTNVLADKIVTSVGGNVMVVDSKYLLTDSVKVVDLRSASAIEASGVAAISTVDKLIQSGKTIKVYVDYTKAAATDTGTIATPFVAATVYVTSVT